MSTSAWHYSSLRWHSIFSMKSQPDHHLLWPTTRINLRRPVQTPQLQIQLQQNLQNQIRKLHCNQIGIITSPPPSPSSFPAWSSVTLLPRWYAMPYSVSGFFFSFSFHGFHFLSSLFRCDEVSHIGWLWPNEMLWSCDQLRMSSKTYIYDGT